MNYFLVGIVVLVAALLGRSDAFVVSIPPSFGVAATASPSSSLRMTVLSYNGKKKDFKAGTPLSKAVASLGVKPTYSCKK